MSQPLLGTGGQASLPPSVETVLFDATQNGGPISGFRVKNNDDTVDAKIRVHGMHIDQSGAGGSDGMAIVGPGESVLFAWDHQNIELVSGKSASGTITITGFVQSRR